MAPLPGRDGGDLSGKLSKAKVIDETKWCLYCCCDGWGLGPFSDPLIASEAKHCCLRGSCATTDCMGTDGLCNNIEVMCCITQECHLPPVKDAPVFACLNLKCCGSCGSTEFVEGLFDQGQIMNDTFWINYCICSGCGINKMDQGLLASQFKQCCLRGYSNFEPPLVDGVCCSAVSTQCCIWGECEFPPHKPNPIIACCTWRLNNEKVGAPSQRAMQ